MGKRKNTDNEVTIKRKIRKLEKKLHKSRYRRLVIESSDETNDDETTNNAMQSKASEYKDTSSIESIGHALSRTPSPVPATVNHYENPIPGTSAHIEVTSEEVKLQEEILQLLGDAPKTERALGPPVHNDIASRWQEILAKGIEKDGKDKLIEEYLIPNNCDLLTAPILNPEAKAALPEIKVKRDASLMHRQKQLGIAIAALTSGLELIISNEASKQKVIKPISDACRLLCDIHYNDTKLRRDFVINSINSHLKETLIDTTRNKYLFGENVTEKLKATQSIHKTGASLKGNPKTTFKNNTASRSNTFKDRLNYKQQPRKYNNKRSNEAAPVRQAPHLPRPVSNSYKSRARSPQRKHHRR